MSAVFAVEQVAHRFAAGSVGAFVGLPAFGGFRAGIGGVFFTAFGTAVVEGGLAGFHLEFFGAADTSLEREWHLKNHGLQSVFVISALPRNWRRARTQNATVHNV